jgi:uncharacterized membrane protein
VSTAALEQALVEAAPRLTARVLAEMYADPFWAARFGERGRGHARQDGDYHLTYVVEALRADDPAVFVKYARWLRDLLVARGMCSRHLADNFARLAIAIDGEPWPDRGEAVAVLQAGIDALRHRQGDAGMIDDHRAALVAAVVTRLRRDRPGLVDRWDRDGGPGCVDELDAWLSYLADALALAQPERFTAHVAFARGLLARRGLGPGDVDAAVTALAAVVAAEIPAALRPASYLDAARQPRAAAEGA